MSTFVDLLMVNAAQLVTCAVLDGPKRGPDLLDVGLIRDGGLAVSDGFIVDVGQSHDLLRTYDARHVVDATGMVVCPGFVDCHTHAVYAGQRIDEFELRTRGRTYQEIMAAGGGILSTVRQTRQAAIPALMQQSRRRLERMLRLGTTSVEIKSGYGLDTVTELKMLQVIDILAQQTPLDVVPTFLGAHAVPNEYRQQPQEFVDLIVTEMLPRVATWYAGSWMNQSGVILYNDVFCEAGAFDLEQARRVLEAGEALGMPAKIHVDEFTSFGGIGMAVGLGACSADHLDVTTAADAARLAASDTIGVLMPAVNLNLGGTHFADGRMLIDAGAAVALATDINPGSAPCPSMPMVMALACRYNKLLPGEALNAATINAAYAVGLGDRVGSLELGKQADILLVDAPDYRYLAYEFGVNLVKTVFKRGTIVGV